MDVIKGNIVLVMYHSGGLPDYLSCTFQQIRMFNSDIAIHFLTDKNNVNDPIFKMYDVTPINKDLYYTSEITLFEKCFGRNKDDFWTVTIIRLFFISNYINQNNFYNIYVIENDILLYYSLRDHHITFIKLYDEMAITTAGDDKCMTGLLFVKTPIAMRMMMLYMLRLVTTLTKKEIINIYKMDMIHEMSLMRAYSKDYPEDLQHLPILPFGEFSKNYEVFNSIFDPASWGQYVGGTTDGIPGAKPSDHYIGRLLQNNPDYTVIWKEDDQNRKIPYFDYQEKQVRINNLHIHSKNLHKYLS